MATAPDMLATPDVVIRTMVEPDVSSVVAIERAAYQFPWTACASAMCAAWLAPKRKSSATAS
jgi:hypothetical protein